NGHRKVSGRDDAPSVEDGASQPEEPVCKPTAGKGKQIHKHRIETIDGAARLFVKSHAAVFNGRYHVEEKDSPHAIIAEALPHFSKKQRCESAGMAKETFVRMHSKKR